MVVLTVRNTVTLSRGCVRTLFCDMFLVIESEVYREALYSWARSQPVDTIS